MVKKRVACSRCGKGNYRTKGACLEDNLSYSKLYECVSCGNSWRQSFSLVAKDSNKYHYLHLHREQLNLQRWVWEQAHGRLLAPTECVHHLNGRKGDNRPSNLYAMVGKHSPYLASNNDLSQIQKLKKQVRKLEDELNQLRMGTCENP